MVEHYLLDLQFVSEEFYQITLKVRECFLAYSDDVKEEIKYGGVVFLVGKTLLGGVFAYKNYVSVDFSLGAQFNDLFSVLEGKGRYRRHIKLFTQDEVETKHLNFYINESMNQCVLR